MTPDFEAQRRTTERKPPINLDANQINETTAKLVDKNDPTPENPSEKTSLEKMR